MVKEDKKEMEEIKKTAEAHGTLSEETAEEKAKDSEKVAKELIEKEAETKETSAEKTPDKRAETRGRGRHSMSDADKREEILSAWDPKTKLGTEVRNKVVTDIDVVLDSKRKILEEEIVDSLILIQTDLISIGQAKGKFGGGKRRAWRQTQRKTKEGNVATFSTMAVIGDEKGHVGLGIGKAKETLPARDKATRKAKLNIIKIKRSCSGFDCACDLPHTVPFKVLGKEGSCRVTLIPAPQGTGLVAANEIKKILKLAGIRDIYTKTFGKQRTTFNLAKACFDALKKTNTQ
ncbi:MAG: 30S ribosomal protein S5 [Nanoarchaeota archaeon]|nr:30S ribosomal protein S5 [Nanoarchaeota archaeon]